MILAKKHMEDLVRLQEPTDTSSQFTRLKLNI
jgi:hypothetical protein